MTSKRQHCSTVASLRLSRRIKSWDQPAEVFYFQPKPISPDQLQDQPSPKPSPEVQCSSRPSTVVKPRTSQPKPVQPSLGPAEPSAKGPAESQPQLSPAATQPSCSSALQPSQSPAEASLAAQPSCNSAQPKPAVQLSRSALPKRSPAEAQPSRYQCSASENQLAQPTTGLYASKVMQLWMPIDKH